VQLRAIGGQAEHSQPDRDPRQQGGQVVDIAEELFKQGTLWAPSWKP